MMVRMIAALCFALMLGALPTKAKADPGDVDAAARGVVRVVLITQEGEELIPISHGSGFAVTSNRIVTNAHVIREALQDDTLRIGIVPNDGADAVFAKPVAVSPRNDLALLELIEGGLRLSPLTIAGGVSGDMGEVSAVGYPMNVDLAQGLEISDIFKAQPPVKSRGFLSGERPSRDFDTILHTAPIARGNSGGPLLDGCGRVLGVNSFGADSDGSDAEFYFAVSLRELMPFLRENDVDPRTNALPCRSIEDLNAAELDRFNAERAEAQARIEAREEELRDKRSTARSQVQLEVMEERENAMALAMVLMLLAIGCFYAALQMRHDPETRARMVIFAALSGAAVIGAVLAWITRPSFSQIEERVAVAMGESEEEATDENTGSGGGEGTLICTFVSDRSRVTSAKTDDVEFDWSGDGCVNGRTQYGLRSGEWSRVFVPNDEATVSVNSYDPESRTFQTERYLLRRSAMQEAREARGEYRPSACGVSDAANTLGDQQSKVLSLLPDRPNERLVYQCEAKSGD
ncbi:MAG: trypsin-like peptidase domain-containing protein [Erythrobacter sp.]